MRTFRTGFLLLSIAVAIMAATITAHGAPGRHRVINASNPGEKVDLTRYVVPGKVNVFDFYSTFCPPCMRLSPLLEQLAEKDPQVVVNKVDINRSGVEGIDWDSPVVAQYGLRSVPHFIIYDAQGKKVAEGASARTMVIEMMQKAGVH